ncbi:RidA family protein [Mycolicibacterium mageritense]|uniref:RidA family protein n=1 Tax=Mycolicibacterium mageritense TaxID=53462 RepID=UPI002573C83D|nr:RidA family protein [Mycolicibacterium mageritense]
MSAPVTAHGQYVPATTSGNTVMSAGMTPRINGVLAERAVVGTAGVSGEISVARAAALAGLSAERAVNACKQVLPPDATLVRPVSLTVYVRSGPDFEHHSEVADGASQVLAGTFSGQLPARAAIGVASLPGGSPVEVVLTAEWATTAMADDR